VPLPIYSWSNNSISLPVPQDNCTGPVVVTTVYGASNPVTLTIVGSTPGRISTNHPPMANAGPNQTVFVGSTVQLNGSGSTDQDGDTLTYRWLLISAPSGSTASLSSTTTVMPTFVPDKPGSYTVQLIVNDGHVGQRPEHSRHQHAEFATDSECRTQPKCTGWFHSATQR
jgi:K319L-like, PKD domain